MERQEIIAAIAEAHFEMFDSNDFDQLVRDLLIKGYVGLDNLSTKELVEQYADFVLEENQSVTCEGITASKDDNGVVTYA